MNPCGTMPSDEETLSSFLKRERELRHIPLEQVAEETKISIGKLRAIEEGRWGCLPGEFFLKGFLRQYAETISLDMDLVMERYNRERAFILGSLPGGGSDSRMDGIPEERPPLLRNPYLWVLFLIVLVLAGLGYWYWRQ